MKRCFVYEPYLLYNIVRYIVHSFDLSNRDNQMKFHNVLEDLLSSKTKFLLLKTLFRYSEKKFSGRELGRLAGCSASRTSEVLNLFHSYGLVNKIHVGNTAVWTLNKENILCKELSYSFQIEKKLLKVLKSNIRNAFSSQKEVLKVLLFGSLIRGDEKPNSDIDLFILVQKEKDKKTAEEVTQKLNISQLPLYGNVISSILYSKDEWRQKRTSELFKKIHQENEVILNRID